MKYLIVGLGNPGAEYDRTRHNVGFMALDAYARTAGVAFAPARLGEVAMASYRGRQLLLLKPSTFMNLSGKAVRYWMQQENVPPERTLVLVDDLALPLGTVRLRAKGSAGGHNGLKDIEAQLQTAAYPRLRIGIGHEFPRGIRASRTRPCTGRRDHTALLHPRYCPGDESGEYPTRPRGSARP